MGERNQVGHKEEIEVSWVTFSAICFRQTIGERRERGQKEVPSSVRHELIRAFGRVSKEIGRGGERNHKKEKEG